ncbi:transglutaminase-like domain-containing protein [Roseiconus lacunae]|uniref:Transglutaminase family protein n=1 Tax=Roseiconus lacunae TaxID=2605694 RepID=A0ABT7PRY2_9BACT|nr:transglutaminase family protein [Roseiconus lacunae]MDM4019103.1 transglutaminase family protein [Roseiconus lacunae]
MSRIKILLLLLPLFGCLACDRLIPPRPPIGPAKDSVDDQADPATAQSGADLNANQDAADFEGDWRAWYVHRMGRQVVGISEVSAERVINETVLESGEAQVRYQRKDQLIVRQNTLQFLQITDTQSIESLRANVKTLTSSVTNGLNQASISASRRGNRLAFRFQASGGEPTTQDVVWADGMRGPFAVEQSLRREMMQPGESRRLEGLNSTVNAVAVFELRCTGKASVSMLDGQYETLTEIEVTTLVDAKPVDDQVLWLQDDGVIKKTLRPLIRLESFYVSSAAALNEFTRPLAPVVFSAEGTFGTDSEGRESADVSQFTQAGYIVSKLSGRLQGDETLVPAFGNQFTNNVVVGQQVLVSGDGTAPGEFTQVSADVAAGDLAATKLLETGHPAVVKLAGKTSSDDQVTLESIREVARICGDRLTLVPQGPLRSASQSLRQGQGGEIDQAIVLAAVLRAKQIPARIVLGLAPAAEQSPGSGRTLMKLTGWVTVYVDAQDAGQWVSIDPVSRQTNAVDRLALAVSTSETELSVDLAESFERLGKLRIQIRGGR